jgi:hypothetical protein
LKPGGGLTWLQFEIAVPPAMIGVAMLLLGLLPSLNHAAEDVPPVP